jgi:predicted anti-sigma-YlaC factor YlaD
MTCKEAIRVMCEYLEGRLSRSVALAVQRHLFECRDCRIVHDAAERTLAIYFDSNIGRHATDARKVRVA